MSVANTTNIAATVATINQTAFPFSFKIFATADIVVYSNQFDVNYQLRIEATHYTVAFDAAAETGTVTMLSGVDVGKIIVITRAEPKTQGSVLPREGKMPEKVIETALDKLTLTVQDLSERVDRAPTQPIAPALPGTITFEAPVVGKGGFWVADGDNWVFTNTTDDLDTAATEAAASAAAAASSATAAASSATAADASAIAAAASAAAASEESSGTFAARPASPTTSIQYYSTDTDELFRYSVAAAKWFLQG